MPRVLNFCRWRRLHWLRVAAHTGQQVGQIGLARIGSRGAVLSRFPSFETPRARPRRCRSRLSLRVVDNPGDHSHHSPDLRVWSAGLVPKTTGRRENGPLAVSLPSVLREARIVRVRASANRVSLATDYG